MEMIIKLFTRAKKNLLIKSFGKKINQKITLIGKITIGFYTKN